MSSSYSQSPTIYTGALPHEERQAAWHLFGLLDDLGSYLRRFDGAVTLYAHADALIARYSVDLQNETVPKKRFALLRARQADPSREWLGIAQRDAIMTVYHFSQTLEAITFGECPTLRGWVNHEKLRMARNIFDGHFSQAEAARHSVAHSAEMKATLADIQRNSLKDGYSSENIKVSAGVSLMMSAVQVGSKYLSTWTDAHTGKARIVTSECTRDALSKLERVRELICEAFHPAQEKSHAFLFQRLDEEAALLHHARWRIVRAIASRHDPS
jgi:hypothetical protein